MTQEPAGARCAKHPDVAAVAPCARCGTFLCGTCTEVVGEAAYCPECVVWLRQNGPPSRWVQAFIGLNVAGIVCFPLCGFSVPVINILAAALGLWLPARELHRIRIGEGPVRGARQAKLARGLAVVNVLLTLLWAAAFLYAWRSGAVY